MGAIAEQLTHTGHIRSVEIGKVEACQTIAIHKHAAIPIITTAWPLPPRTAVAEYLNPIAHGNDIGGAEIGEVKACQSAATPKHGIHVFYIRGVEVGYIQACQILTPIKESTHVGHLGGVETGKVETCETATTGEHTHQHIFIVPFVSSSIWGSRVKN